jgi:DNA mismatch repair protein MutS
MGARLLRKWLVLPLKEKSLIQERLNTVAFFKNILNLEKPYNNILSK